MPQAGVYVLTSLISGVSAALILASSSSYTKGCSPQGIAYNVERGRSTYNGYRTSPCQVAYLNSVEDFCLWAPSQPVLSAARNTEHTLVAWCMESAHGTRLIPDGTISEAHFVITPEFVQIMGVGNLTNINVPADGVASVSDEGDRVNDFVSTCAYGQLEQIYDWTSFVSQERFCFRACKPSATASTTCPQIHDVFECSENVPADYHTGLFGDCIGDAIDAPSTMYQDVLAAPSHHSARLPPGCTARGIISNAHVARARRAMTSMSSSSSPALVTLLSRLHRDSTSSTSSVSPTTTSTTTSITFPSFPPSASALTSTAFTSSSTPVSFPTETSTLYSHSYTHTRPHRQSHTYRHSHYHSHTLSASVSSSSSDLSSSDSQSSLSTASLLSDPSSASPVSSPALSTASFTLSYSSSDTSSGTSTSTPITTLASTAPASGSSLWSSSDGMSSSLSEPSPSQPSPYQSSTLSSAATPTLPPTSLSASSSTASQSSDVLSFPTFPSSSSVPATSTATSSPTSPNSQTQLGSQCPPPSQAAGNARSAVPSPGSLLSVTLTVLMTIIPSYVGVLVL